MGDIERAGRLQPGKLDFAAIDAFRHGACGALAIAIHDRTGWPIFAITDHHNVYDGQAGGGSALHWAVRHPSGLLLDVDGLHSAEDLVEAYNDDADDGQAAAGRSTRADVHEWYIECQGEPIPVALAASYVDAVLEKAAQHHRDPSSTMTPP